MRLSGYMSSPNQPIFIALHHTMCYLYHHPHIPIMYPLKPSKSNGSALYNFVLPCTLLVKKSMLSSMDPTKQSCYVNSHNQLPLPTPMPTFEDNQGTINLIRTNHLTDTICHHAITISWFNENFSNDHVKIGYTKTTMMLADCESKPCNGNQIYNQIDNQISRLIGQRYFPLPTQQHYHDLDLDHYSWNKCLSSTPD